MLKVNDYWPMWDRATYTIPALGDIPVLDDPTLVGLRCERVGDLLERNVDGLWYPDKYLIELLDDRRRFVAHKFQIVGVTYFEYVFHDMFQNPKAIAHSGVHSPAINLDPKYDELPLKRFNALQTLGEQTDYLMARRAIEWCAENDQKKYIRDEARDILRRLEEVQQ